LSHIAFGNTNTCYISLVRSFGVAADYALFAGRTPPSSENPAFVYEIHIPHQGISVLEPVIVFSELIGSSSAAYHNGGGAFLRGAVDPVGNFKSLTQSVRGPHGVEQPMMLPELEVLVHALRDTEVLALREIPRSLVAARYDIF
jgi:hypothetical protein